MSAPYDRPAGNEPGGCECMECGVIFVGAEHHDKCAVCAAGWHPIHTAPTDGTSVKAGTVGPMSVAGIPLYPITSRFVDGEWRAVFGDNRWARYDPQPNRWQAISITTPDSSTIGG